MTRVSAATHPVDHGYAWVVLASCSVMRMLLEGFWSSLGVLFVKLEIHFGVSSSETSLIGSIFMLIFLSIAPVSSALAHRLTHRVVVVGGGIITFICCFAVSFVTTFWHIYIIMALLSLGMGLPFPASFSYFIYYFDKHFALAHMLNSASSGIGFLAIPPLMELLISSYGWKGAFQIISAIMANVCVCGALLRPPTCRSKQSQQQNIASNRLSESSQEDHTTEIGCIMFLRDVAKDFDLSLFRSVRFIFQTVLNGTFGAGVMSAIIYLVPFSISIGISDQNSSLLMLAFGISMLVIRLSPVGWIVDRKIISAAKLGGLAMLTFGMAVISTQFTRTFAGLTVVAVVTGLAEGIGGCLMFVVCAYSAGPKEKAPGAVAWFMLVNGISTTVMIFLVGFLYDFTGSYRFSLILCGVCICSLGLNLLLDPCLIRWQNHLEEKRKERSTSSGRVQYASLSDTVQICEV